MILSVSSGQLLAWPLDKWLQVDLVVCNTRVDVHSETIKPSLMVGKSVYCEWPLASNFKAAEELAVLVNEKKVKTLY